MTPCFCHRKPKQPWIGHYLECILPGLCFITDSIEQGSHWQIGPSKNTQGGTDMFDNHTYSILFGLYRYVSPILTLWYVYLFFFRLYPRLAKASLIAETAKVDPEGVEGITDQDVRGYMIMTQLVVSVLMNLIRNKKHK